MVDVVLELLSPCALTQACYFAYNIVHLQVSQDCSQNLRLLKHPSGFLPLRFLPNIERGLTRINFQEIFLGVLSWRIWLDFRACHTDQLFRNRFNENFVAALAVQRLLHFDLAVDWLWTWFSSPCYYCGIGFHGLIEPCTHILGRLLRPYSFYLDLWFREIFLFDLLLTSRFLFLLGWFRWCKWLVLLFVDDGQSKFLLAQFSTRLVLQILYVPGICDFGFGHDTRADA